MLNRIRFETHTQSEKKQILTREQSFCVFGEERMRLFPRLLSFLSFLAPFMNQVPASVGSPRYLWNFTSCRSVVGVCILPSSPRLMNPPHPDPPSPPPPALTLLTAVSFMCGAFSSRARIWGECSTIHSPPALFFFVCLVG